MACPFKRSSPAFSAISSPCCSARKRNSTIGSCYYSLICHMTPSVVQCQHCTHLETLHNTPWLHHVLQAYPPAHNIDSICMFPNVVETSHSESLHETFHFTHEMLIADLRACNICVSVCQSHCGLHEFSRILNYWPLIFSLVPVLPQLLVQFIDPAPVVDLQLQAVTKNLLHTQCRRP
jgi:hypothetical protein